MSGIGPRKGIQMRIAISKEAIDDHDALEVVTHCKFVRCAHAAMHLNRLVLDHAARAHGVRYCAHSGALAHWSVQWSVQWSAERYRTLGCRNDGGRFLL